MSQIFKSENWDKIHEVLDEFPFRSKLLSLFHEQQQRELLELWLYNEKAGRILYTDLFDEAKGYTGSLQYLIKQDYQIFGIDISSRVISNFKQKEAKSIHYSVCDVCTLPFSNHFFNYIVSFSTLDHCSENDFIKALKELHRILALGGKIILTLHNAHNAFFYFYFMKKREVLPFYIESFSLNRAKKLLEDCGFSVQKHTAIVQILFPETINKVCHWAEKNGYNSIIRLLRGYLSLCAIFQKTIIKYLFGKFIAICAVKK